METETEINRNREAVVQFSVFTPNRLGQLYDLVRSLTARNVQVLAMTILDATDSAVVRFVVDDPDKARMLLDEGKFPFTESALVIVEVAAPDELTRLMSALLEAELNINYLYSFIPHPNGKSILGLSLEDNEMAEQILKRHQFRILRQSDILR